jgi:hypothetical protein
MLPTDPALIDAYLQRATPEERDEIMALIDADMEARAWRAQVGRQSEAADSEADVTGYGGAAGGGKTDLIAGLALTEHQRSAIFRREKAQTEGIVQRMTEILGSTDGYNSQKSIWRTTVSNVPRLIELGGLDNPDDHLRWQGRPHDLKAVDEATECREQQVRFVLGWNRTSDPKQRTRGLLTFNPPTTIEGRWVIDFFAPWLSDRFSDPAKPGELRWVTTIGGKDVWVDGPEPFVIFKGEPLYDFDHADFGPEKIIRPKSRTFIPSRVTDNYFYVRTGYIQTLQSLPEPLRSQMLSGDFTAGVEDDEWQVIPTAWIDAAMARWEPRQAKGEMDTLGCDPAMGGKDKFVLAPRHGTWFDQLIRVPGAEVPDGQTGAAIVVKHRRDRAVVNIDVIGWGSSTLNMLQENEVQCHAVNGSSKSLEVSESGNLRFANYRSEIVWRMREGLDPNNQNPWALPLDPALKADLAAYKWKMTAAGVQVRSKDEMKHELGRSPDDGDAVIMAAIPTMKLAVYEELRDKTRGGFDRYAELPDYQPMGKSYDRYSDA